MNARDQYETACAHDRKGDESAAIPCYEKALELGLSGDDRKLALLGLGSSLRNVGRHQDSVNVLFDAVAEYPDHLPLKVFLSLSLHTAGLHREATELLLSMLVNELPAERFDGYLKAIDFYRQNL